MKIENQINMSQPNDVNNNKPTQNIFSKYVELVIFSLIVGGVVFYLILFILAIFGINFFDMMYDSMGKIEILAAAFIFIVITFFILKSVIIKKSNQ